MKNFSKIFVLLILGIVLSSCMKLHQEYWIAKDGSGRYAVSIDASDMLNMMKDMGNMFANESQDYGYNEEDLEDEYREDTIYMDDFQMEEEEYAIEENPWMNEDTAMDTEAQTADEMSPPGAGDYIRESINKIMDSNNLKRLDTIMTAYSLMPDSILATFENPDDLKDFFIRIDMDSAENKMIFGFEFSFNDQASLVRKSALFNSMNKENPGEDLKNFMDDSIDKNFINYFSQLKQGNQIEIEFPKNNLLPPETEGADPADAESYKDFMRQFMGGLEIKTSYHFPGRKIRNASEGRFIISDDRSSITIIFGLEDYLSEAIPDRLVISFE